MTWRTETPSKTYRKKFFLRCEITACRDNAAESWGTLKQVCLFLSLFLFFFFKSMFSYLKRIMLVLSVWLSDEQIFAKYCNVAPCRRWSWGAGWSLSETTERLLRRSGNRFKCWPFFMYCIIFERMLGTNQNWLRLLNEVESSWPHIMMTWSLESGSLYEQKRTCDCRSATVVKVWKEKKNCNLYMFSFSCDITLQRFAAV